MDQTRRPNKIRHKPPTVPPMLAATTRRTCKLSWCGSTELLKFVESEGEPEKEPVPPDRVVNRVSGVLAAMSAEVVCELMYRVVTAPSETADRLVELVPAETRDRLVFNFTVDPILDNIEVAAEPEGSEVSAILFDVDAVAVTSSA